MQYFYQRVAAAEGIEASPASEAVKCLIVSAPDVIVGEAAIRVNKIEGYEYCLDDMAWQSNNTFNKYIVPGETYTVYQRPINTSGINVYYNDNFTTVCVKGEAQIAEPDATTVVWLQEIILGKTVCNSMSADFNADGKIDLLDLIRLKKILTEKA